MSAPRVSIVMPLYDNAHLTRQCLDGLYAHTDPALYELIAVDNASTDETPQLLAAEAAEGRLRIVTVAGPNIGFAGACNLGAASATAPLLLFLNNDTVPHAGWLEAMLAAAARPEVGIVGAKLLYPDGTIQHAGMALREGVPDHPYRFAPADLPEANVARELDMVTGAVLLIRRELFESFGGFDTAYRNGCEDVELCLRTREAGYVVWYEPTAVVDHHEAQSKDRWDRVRDNLRLYLERWGSRFDADGRFVASRAADAVVWRGDGGSAHSLAVVNDGVLGALRRSGLAVYRTERGSAPLDHPGVGVAAHWPPDWRAPSAGPYVLYQPWEFGEIPAVWAEQIRSRVDEVWTPSEYARQAFLAAGLAPELVHVVPNGVDLDRFSPDGPAYPLPDRPATVFLFVGGTTYRKGIDLLLNAYAAAFDDGDDVLLVVKGFGSDTFYRGQTAEQALAEFARTPGTPRLLAIDDQLGHGEVAALYRAADCVVQPYRGEGFCLPALEALACGTPVVVTAGGPTDEFTSPACAWQVPSRCVPLAPSLLRDEMAPAHGGFLLEPDADALVAALREAADPDRRAAKAAAARSHAERCSWAAAAGPAQARLAALAGTTPVRTLAPQRLDDARSLLLAALGEWEPALDAYADAFAADDDVTLALPGASEAEALAVLRGREDVADVALVPALADPTPLVLGADAVVGAGHPRARRTLPADPAALRALLLLEE